MCAKYTPEQRIAAFWSKIAISGDDDCWEWQAGLHKKGYGLFRWSGGRTFKCHRIAYVLTFGDIPKGLHVLHRCDNPPCCNPRHLFLGTNLDNAQDRVRKGRDGGHKRRGMGNGRCKITDQQVSDMRQLYRNGISIAELASQFGLSKTHTRRLATGQRRI